MRYMPLFLVMATACPTTTEPKTSGETGTYVTDTDTQTPPTTAETGTTTDSDTTPVPTDTVLMSFEEVVAPVLSGFGGVGGSVVVDPTDATNHVAQVDKPDPAETWAGVTISYCPADGIAHLPFSATATQMSVRVWSPDAGIPVRLKVEKSSDPTTTCETEAVTTVAGAWETLVFDFSAQAAGTAALDVTKTYDKVSLFPNFGTTGTAAGAKTYYVDDVTFLGVVFPPDCPVAPQPGETLPITFDDANTTYGFTNFGGVETASVVADPDDGTNNVATATKGATAEIWAGTTFSTLPADLVTTIPFTATQLTMEMRVRSPRAGIPVLLKVEQGTYPAHSMEVAATTTGVDTWETLQFDFATSSVGAFDPTYTYDKVSVFFDFGTSGSSGGSGTFYWDDVNLLP